MRCELFRCDQCSELYPKDSKKTVIIQPLPTSSIASESYAQQGVRMVVNLIDSTCSRCYNNVTLIDED